MDISIVIVNYNVRDYILKCLDTIFASPLQMSTEVIVVDNNSHDGSVEAIAAAYPQVKLIINKYNDGFSAANNQAFQVAEGRYILMLNPDTELTEDSLHKLFSFLENNAEFSIVAPKLTNTDGSLQQSVWRFPSVCTLFFDMFYLTMFLKKKNYADKDMHLAFEVDSISGAALLFRREVIEKIGMLDETLFWIEDIDFCYRAHKAGLRTLYYPDSQVIHHVSKSAKLNYNISISNQIFSKIKYFRKHKNFVSTFLLTIISLINVLLRFIVFGLLSPFSKIYWRKAKAYLYTLPKVIVPPKGIK
ncbi:MAG TPA: glycosyltransferase family 2 protein [Bacteroidales bacterium]|nr:glycosyltransferase family 2 protein [Bacteroidales bacterium]